jgi:hypothetical protein
MESLASLVERVTVGCVRLVDIMLWWKQSSRVEHYLKISLSGKSIDYCFPRPAAWLAERIRGAAAA